MITNGRTNIVSERKNDYKTRPKIKIKPIFKEYIEKNFKEVICVIALFLIGIILSVLFTNNANEMQKEEITTYIQNYFSNLKARRKHK